MRVSGYLFSGAPLLRQYLASETNANGGVLVGATADGGLANPTSTSARADVYGLALDTATYSTTPSLGATGILTVDVRPDAIINAKYSGAATEDTALTILVQDTASTTVLTDTGVGSDDIDGGWIWRYQNEGEEAPLSEQRQITAFSSGASLTVTVAFESSIAVGDRMLAVPQALVGTAADGTDGAGNILLSTLFTQVDVTEASGTGLAVSVYNIICRSEVDSEVEFLSQSDRVFMNGSDTV